MRHEHEFGPVSQPRDTGGRGTLSCAAIGVCAGDATKAEQRSEGRRSKAARLPGRNPTGTPKRGGKAAATKATAAALKAAALPLDLGKGNGARLTHSIPPPAESQCKKAAPPASGAAGATNAKADPLSSAVADTVPSFVSAGGMTITEEGKPKLSVTPCKVFFGLTHSKQTIGALTKCHTFSRSGTRAVVAPASRWRF